MALHPTLSPPSCPGNVNGAGRGIQGTAIELSSVASWGFLPLPARNEWGEGWGEGNPNKNGPPLPDPLLPLWGGEGEFLAASPVLFLNSMAVPLIPLPAPFTFAVQQRGERAGRGAMLIPTCQ